ncbi:MAG: hypothetical protein CVT59_09460 [Actinobacteria bacterium HGW-Actinobacteria-1]|jgi:hypothetical protein|nr:MAG: hypothetical protein CVT59_09460 [Actinobacteria bacterium HGW-Actinobacteria-1]
MEFSLICPNDGQVDLSLEDITAVAFRDPETVEVSFLCPQCGQILRASLRVPNMLMAAMELAHFAENDEYESQELVDSQWGLDPRAGEERVERERVEESYCEYFRRQLSHVECVEDLLAEIDS